MSDNEILVGSFELEGAAPNMPVIGPLLMIWRDIAAKLDAEARSGDDMTERLMDVIDNAIAGATAVPDTLGGVARTIAFADQARGQVDAPLMWRKFVDDVAALFDEHHRRGSRFVVRIERVPHERRVEVERVTRRFAHPRIEYDVAR